MVLIDLSTLHDPSSSTYFQETGHFLGWDHYYPDGEAVCFPEPWIPTYLITLHNLLEDNNISAMIYLRATLLLKGNQGTQIE
jgi:hypothetical protein